jgi:hypothetical protein
MPPQAGVIWDRVTAGWTRRGYPEPPRPREGHQRKIVKEFANPAGSRGVLYVTPPHQKAAID